MGQIAQPLSFVRAAAAPLAARASRPAVARLNPPSDRTELLIQSFDPGAPWWHEQLRNALEQSGVRDAPSTEPGRLSNVWRSVAHAGLARNMHRGPRALLGITGNRGWARWLPWGLWNEVVPYAFDCWEPWWDHWERALRRFRVRVAFFSARQAAAEMARRIPGLRAHWIPEAINPAGYSWQTPLQERDTHVLEFGRRHPVFGPAATDALSDLGARHVHPTQGRLFPDHRGVRDALSNARALVCFPRCDTHRERAGSVETLTARYFEGIASGCVLVGRAPQELIDLFGYNPVVQADPANPRDVLRRIVHEPAEFQALVDRNRVRLHRVGTWDVRVRQLLHCLQYEGYRTVS